VLARAFAGESDRVKLIRWLLASVALGLLNRFTVDRLHQARAM
jgi:hypothetical protein